MAGVLPSGNRRATSTASLPNVYYLCTNVFRTSSLFENRSFLLIVFLNSVFYNKIDSILLLIKIIQTVHASPGLHPAPYSFHRATTENYCTTLSLVKAKRISLDTSVGMLRYERGPRRKIRIHSVIGHRFDRRPCLPTSTPIEDTARRAQMQLSLSALSSERFSHLTSRLAVAWSCQMRSGMHTFMGTCRSHSIRTRGPMSYSQFILAFSPNYLACARHEQYPHTALTDGASKHLLTDAPRIQSLAGALRTAYRRHSEPM